MFANTRPTTRTTLAAAVAGALAFAPATAIAAGMSAAPSGQMLLAQEGSGQYGEAVLKSYAKAVVDVQRVDAAAKEQIGEDASPEEADRIMSSAYQDMVGAVQANGISVEQYNDIARTSQADPALQQKIAGYIQQAEQGQL